MKTAIIVVDMQNDFCEGGALPVKGAKALVPGINRLIAELPNALVVFSRDWHPKATVHFDKWPVHCVRGTAGASLVEGLKQPEDRTDYVFKGTGDADDGYSAFEGMVWGKVSVHDSTLQELLDREQVDTVCVCGVATDYCVRATAVDARQKGYNTFLVTNLIAGVDTVTTTNALTEMSLAGIHFYHHGARDEPDSPIRL